jgi:HTH-type transcriptional regulator/antitoxin HigA
MRTDNAVYSNLAIPPGEYLEEVLGELGMTKEELARRMDRPASKLSHIFKGRKAITADTALQLEKVIGVPAHIWTGLEAEYRLTLARHEEIRRNQQVKDEIPLLTSFCYASLVRLGAVEKKDKRIDRVIELQKFFGVTSLKNVIGMRPYQAAFRSGKGGREVPAPEAQAAWLRLGELRARQMVCKSFDSVALRDSLPQLRSMTRLQPQEFLNPLRETLAAAGVAAVICPHFPKTQAHGATFWLKSDRAVLMLSSRYRWADIFWFSLFHEIAHLLLHGQSVILEYGAEDERESEANRFAADHLIPQAEYRRFVKQGAFSLANILSFAHRTGIHPGIAVGRLQHDGYLKANRGNSLRMRYDIAAQ